MKSASKAALVFVPFVSLSAVLAWIYQSALRVSGPIRIRHSLTIARPMEIVLRSAQEFENFETSENGALIHLNGVDATLRFQNAPADRGTEIKAEVLCPPGTTRLVAQMIDRALLSTLRRFKQLTETGEVISTAGRGSSKAA
ncbi:MAG: hypothetical protein ACJ763_10955 [Bdellovibrionia bacterium]